VLQVLALLAREAGRPDSPLDGARIAELAREQERVLRRLTTHAPSAAGGDALRHPRARREIDLSAALHQLAAGSSVPVSAALPAGPVLVGDAVGDEIVAAVAAALDNVARHAGAGARAFLLVEDEPDAITVSVRDDGAGMPPGRLAAAAREGRLGVRSSISGRIRDLGGTVTVTSAPGAGTEIEISVPRTAPSARPVRSRPVPS
jgi:signal transduction histidine kinase